MTDHVHQFSTRRDALTWSGPPILLGTCDCGYEAYRVGNGEWKELDDYARMYIQWMEHAPTPTPWADEVIAEIRAARRFVFGMIALLVIFGAVAIVSALAR